MFVSGHKNNSSIIHSIMGRGEAFTIVQEHNGPSYAVEYKFKYTLKY